MYPSVIKVVPSENYVLHIEFDNGENGMLDMKPYLSFGVFRSLKNLRAFSQVRVVFDTIEWESGIDLDPEFVYEKCSRKLKEPESVGNATLSPTLPDSR